MSEAHYLDIIDAAARATFGHQVGQHIILGSTIDDSIGEAFDKTVLLSVQIKSLQFAFHAFCSVKFCCKARVLGITQVLDSSNWGKDTFSVMI